MKYPDFQPHEIENIRDIDACKECLEERAAGGASDEKLSSFAIGNADVCDTCLKMVFGYAFGIR